MPLFGDNGGRGQTDRLFGPTSEIRHRSPVAPYAIAEVTDGREGPTHGHKNRYLCLSSRVRDRCQLRSADGRDAATPHDPVVDIFRPGGAVWLAGLTALAGVTGSVRVAPSTRQSSMSAFGGKADIATRG